MRGLTNVPHASGTNLERRLLADRGAVADLDPSRNRVMPAMRWHVDRPSVAQFRRHLNDFVATLAPPTPGRPALDCLLDSMRASLADPSGAWSTRVGPGACFDPELVKRAGPNLGAPIPDDVWIRILATIVRMLSSDRNPYAAFPDLGEIGERPMHAVFDESLDLLSDAMRRIRCMLLAEHALNREVRAAIERARGAI
jgi:hypothetical protein